jgi:hypothetical protein
MAESLDNFEKMFEIFEQMDLGAHIYSGAERRKHRS